MTPSNRTKFRPPSNGFCSRLFDTPLFDLVRGRVSGSSSARRTIASANLPGPVADAIWRCLPSGWLPSRSRLSLAVELVSSSARQLAAGRSVEDLATEINERAALADVISAGGLASQSVPRRMPLELCNVIGQIASRVHGKINRREVALALYERCAVELSAGVTAGQLIERFGDAEVVVPLVRRRRLRPIILESSLPIELLRIVQRIAAGTKLWKTEQDDVARELCDHFADGLTAGRTPRELAGAFGAPAVAARLIRRAKVRNRPLAWHAWRRSWQVTLAVCAVVVLLWSWLVFRFHTVRPGAAPDHIAEWDTQTSAIPVSERAWPLYREGLEKIDRTQMTSKKWDAWHPVEDALSAGPRHRNWPEAREFLHQNQESLTLFVKASERREFGYIYRDRANDKWLHRSAEEMYPREEPDLWIKLPHIQDMRLAALLFAAAAHEALAAGDGERALEMLRARLRMVDQLWRASEFCVVDTIALWNLTLIEKTVARSLAEQPQILDDRELKVLAHELAAVCDGNPRIRFDGERAIYDDWIARAYSHDADGRGRFTAAGIMIVCKMVQMYGKTQEGVFPEWDWMGTQLADSATGGLAFDLAGSGLAAVVGDRQEMQTELDKLINLRVAEIESPYWERPAASAYVAELVRLQTNPSLRRRVSPLLAIMNPTLSEPDRRDFEDSGMRAVIDRDTALVAIALELFHRREGRWPDGLQNLVPGLLPRVPLDQFDGKPLRYRLIEGRPNVYSVGPDRQDDGGIGPADGTSGRKAAKGDWRLLPPTEDPEE